MFCYELSVLDLLVCAEMNDSKVTAESSCCEGFTGGCCSPDRTVTALHATAMCQSTTVWFYGMMLQVGNSRCSQRLTLHFFYGPTI